MFTFKLYKTLFLIVTILFQESFSLLPSRALLEEYFWSSALLVPIGFNHGRKLKVPSRIWAYGSFAFTNSGILTTNSITCFMDVMPCMVTNIGSFGRS